MTWREREKSEQIEPEGDVRERRWESLREAKVCADLLIQGTF